MTTESIDPLDDILLKLMDDVHETVVHRHHNKKSMAYLVDCKNKTKAAINAHYISRERVLEALGEHEPFDFKDGRAIPMMVEEAWKNGRNQLRDAIRKELNL